MSSYIRLVGSILQEMEEITQYLKSSPDRIDNMSASVDAGSTRSVSWSGDLRQKVEKIQKNYQIKVFAEFFEIKESKTAETLS